MSHGIPVIPWWGLWAVLRMTKSALRVPSNLRWTMIIPRIRAVWKSIVVSRGEWWVLLRQLGGGQISLTTFLEDHLWLFCADDSRHLTLPHIFPGCQSWASVLGALGFRSLDGFSPDTVFFTTSTFCEFFLSVVSALTIRSSFRYATFFGPKNEFHTSHQFLRAAHLVNLKDPVGLILA